MSWPLSLPGSAGLTSARILTWMPNDLSGYPSRALAHPSAHPDLSDVHASASGASESAAYTVRCRHVCRATTQTGPFASLQGSRHDDSFAL